MMFKKPLSRLDKNERLNLPGPFVPCLTVLPTRFDTKRFCYVWIYLIMRACPPKNKNPAA